MSPNDIAEARSATHSACVPRSTLGIPCRMNETIASTITQDAFESFLSTRLEPPWLTDLRRNAWKAFQDLPLPHDLPAGPRQEEWRRTDVRRFRFEKFPLPNGETADVRAARQMPDLATAHRRRRSGRPRYGNRQPCRARAGSIPSWPREACSSAASMSWSSDHGAQIEPFLFTRAVDPYYDKFSALHAACWSGGMLLYVPTRRDDRPAAAHVLRACRPGRAISATP